jgi:hypothetical protein
VSDIQLDLFGAVETQLTEAEARDARRAEFERRARRHPDGTEVIWTAPDDCGLGPKGSTHPGWRCWLCGKIEAGDWMLSNNHWVGWMYATDLTREECFPQRQNRMRAAITGEAL